MKHLLLFPLFLASMALSTSAWCRTEFQIRCEDTLPKTVSVVSTQQNGYSVDSSLSYRALTRMSNQRGTQNVVLGLTQMHSRVQIGLTGPVLQDPASGYECVAPQLNVSLIYSPIKVYIGKEFPVGSCGYQEILKHELRHVRVYLDHLPKVESKVRTALAQAFGDRPLYAASGQANSLLQQKIDDSWLAYIQDEMNKVEATQATIDTPNEYQRLARSCGGEIQAIVGAH